MKIDKNNYDTLNIEEDETLSMIAIFSESLKNSNIHDKKNKEENFEQRKIIRVKKWWHLKYLFVCKDDAEIVLDIQTFWENAHIEINGIFLARWWNQLNAQVAVSLKHHKSSAQVHLVSFLKDESSCSIDGNIFIQRWTHGCEGNLLEENILLGDTIKIKTLPMLDVQSNDVVASHGAKIEKLDPQKLFYMQAKGMSKESSEKLLIAGYFETLFKLIMPDIDKNSDKKQCSLKNEREVIKAIQEKHLEYIMSKWINE